MRRRLRLLLLLAPLALGLALAAPAQAGAPSLPVALPAPLASEALLAPIRLAPFTLAAAQPMLQTDDFASAGVVTDDERLRFAFDGLGRLGSRTLERRTGASSWLLEQSQARTYFANGLLESLETRGAAGQLLASHALSYVAGSRFEDGNRTADSFRLVGPDASAPCRAAACSASFAYDGPGRLVQASDGAGTTSVFSLDAAGNVTEERRGGAPYRSASYAGGRLLAETSGGGTRRLLYDGQGNLDCLVASSWAAASCPAAASGQPVAPELLADYVYDYRDRLVATQAYAGGVAGDRSETRYDPLGRPLSSLSTLAGATTATSLVYLGLSHAVVQETQSGAVSASRAYAFDALGSRVSLAHTAAATTSRFSYVAGRGEGRLRLHGLRRGERGADPRRRRLRGGREPERLDREHLVADAGAEQAVCECRIEPVTSWELAEGLVEVLARPRLRRYGISSTDVDALLEALRPFLPTVDVDAPIRDPADAPAVAAAVAGRAEAIVSGVGDLLDGAAVIAWLAGRDVVVLRPRELLERLERR